MIQFCDFSTVSDKMDAKMENTEREEGKYKYK
jgi:hypothetical protein